MNLNSKLAITLLCLVLQLPTSFSTLTQVWEKFWVVSCEYSGHVEKLLPTEGRTKRSIVNEEPDFDDAEEFFKYLYPKADLNPVELGKEGQRSAPSASDTLYAWLVDLGRLWVAECRSRSGHQEFTTKESEPDEGMAVIYGDSDAGDGNSTLMLYDHQQKGNPEINYMEGNPRLYSRQSRALKTGSGTFSLSRHSSQSPRSSYLQAGSNKRTRPRGSSRNSTHNSPKYKLKAFKPSGLLDIWNEDAVTSTDGTVAVAADADAETTTAGPTVAPSAEDSFFSSYGGDIEYFFPLISFGIPFDGEITFLGFHGFKGLFPYK